MAPLGLNACKPAFAKDCIERVIFNADAGFMATGNPASA
jgi:hypothetical protein